MLLKWIYYGVAMILALPFILWSGIVSIIMWDAKYWDNACYGIYQGMDEEENHLNPKNKF
jgi:hypothetical protein